MHPRSPRHVNRDYSASTNCQAQKWQLSPLKEAGGPALSQAQAPVEWAPSRVGQQLEKWGWGRAAWWVWALSCPIEYPGLSP